MLRDPADQSPLTPEELDYLDMEYEGAEKSQEDWEAEEPSELEAEAAAMMEFFEAAENPESPEAKYLAAITSQPKPQTTR